MTTRDERLIELDQRTTEMVDRRVADWRAHSALLRRILEGRTADGEVANHLVTLSLPYVDQSVNDLLAGDGS